MMGECSFAEKKYSEAVEHFLEAAIGYPYDEWRAMGHFEAGRCFLELKDAGQSAGVAGDGREEASRAPAGQGRRGAAGELEVRVRTRSEFACRSPAFRRRSGSRRPRIHAIPESGRVLRAIRRLKADYEAGRTRSRGDRLMSVGSRSRDVPPSSARSWQWRSRSSAERSSRPSCSGLRRAAWTTSIARRRRGPLAGPRRPRRDVTSSGSRRATGRSHPTIAASGIRRPHGMRGDARITPHFTDGGHDAPVRRPQRSRAISISGRRIATPAAGAGRKRSPESTRRRTSWGRASAATGASFISTRTARAGLGGYDLYVAVRASEGWDDVRNLGPTINTPAHEYDRPRPRRQTLYLLVEPRAHSRDSAGRRSDDSGQRGWADDAAARRRRNDVRPVCRTAGDAEAEWGVPRPVGQPARRNDGARSCRPTEAISTSRRTARRVPASRPISISIASGCAAARWKCPRTSARRSTRRLTRPSRRCRSKGMCSSSRPNRDGRDRLYQSVGRRGRRTGRLGRVATCGRSPARAGRPSGSCGCCCSPRCARLRHRARVAVADLAEPVFAGSLLVHLAILLSLLFVQMPGDASSGSRIRSKRTASRLIFEIQQPEPFDGGGPASRENRRSQDGRCTIAHTDRCHVRLGSRPAPLATMTSAAESFRAGEAASCKTTAPVARRAASAAAPEPEAKPALPTLARRAAAPRAAAVDDRTTRPRRLPRPVPQRPSCDRNRPWHGRSLPCRSPDRSPRQISFRD